jgi:hypothetical protein
MTAEETAGKLSRAHAGWILISASAALVAGTGITLDADQWMVSRVGEFLANAGITLTIIWLAVRGVPFRILYPVIVAAILAWNFREIPSGGISADEVRRVAIMLAACVAVVGIIELSDRRKKRREGASGETASAPSPRC